MSRDSVFSQVHHAHPNQALFIEKWHDFKLPYDDIDTLRLFEVTANVFPQLLQDDDEDGAIPLNSSLFGAKLYKNWGNKEKVWTDLGIDMFRSDATLQKLPDKTILKSAKSDAQLSFMANGYEDAESSHDWLLSEFPNHTFSHKFRNSVTQTPRVQRHSSLERNYTPTARNLR